MITVNCPGCTKSLNASEDMAGTVQTCPRCKSRVKIPKAVVAPAAPAIPDPSSASKEHKLPRVLTIGWIEIAIAVFGAGFAGIVIGGFIGVASESVVVGSAIASFVQSLGIFQLLMTAYNDNQTNRRNECLAILATLNLEPRPQDVTK